MAQEPLFFDLETVPNPDILQHLDLPPLREPPRETPADDLPDPYAVTGEAVHSLVTFLDQHHPDSEWIGALMDAELNGKNRKGIFDAIKHHEQDVLKIHGESDKRRKLLATTPEYCRIVALGMAEGDGESDARSWSPDDNADAEAYMLEYFWDVSTRCNPLVGYNIINFDLKVIMARSCILGVQPHRIIDMGWNSRDVLDLMRLRFGNQPPPPGAPGKLKTLCKMYGIPIPAGDVDGSQVEELWQNNPGKLREYVISDVEVTRNLYRRWRGYFVKET